MSWWMYLAPALAGFFCTLKVFVRFSDARLFATEFRRLCVLLVGLCVAPVAIHYFIPTTSAPFWVSLLILLVAFFSFRSKQVSRATRREQGSVAAALSIGFEAQDADSSQQRDIVFREIDINADHFQKAMTLAHSKCRSDEWERLQKRLGQLPIVSARKAKKLLIELHEGEDHTKASSLAAAMAYAAQRTSYNGGNFAELAQRAEERLKPIQYVIALHQWRGLGDSFGTKASYFVRVGEDLWLCAGQTRYGN